MPSSEHSNKHRLVVVRDAAWIGRNIRAPSRKALNLFASGKFHSLDRVMHIVILRVAIDATGDAREITTTGNGIILIVQDRLEHGLRRGLNQPRKGKRNLWFWQAVMYRFERSDIYHHRCEIFIRQAAKQRMGMVGNSVRPSWPIPSRIARAN